MNNNVLTLIDQSKSVHTFHTLETPRQKKCFRQPSILSNSKQIMIKQSRHDAIKNNDHVFETPTRWLFLTSFG